MAPVSNPAIQGRSSSQTAARPVMAAVTRTPIVAMTLAGAQAMRIDRSGVRSPPSNRMIASDRLPSR